MMLISHLRDQLIQTALSLVLLLSPSSSTHYFECWPLLPLSLRTSSSPCSIIFPLLSSSPSLPIHALHPTRPTHALLCPIHSSLLTLFRCSITPLPRTLHTPAPRPLQFLAPSLYLHRMMSPFSPPSHTDFLIVPAILSLLLPASLIFIQPIVIAKGVSSTRATPFMLRNDRLPAVLEIENNCPNATVAVCFKYDKNLYLIQRIPYTALRMFSTLSDDRWVFSKEHCYGDTLLEHTVLGTRKLTMSCTREETESNAINAMRSTTVDCSLTVTPKLSDVFNATLHLVPHSMRNCISNHLFAPQDTPMQFVDKRDFLATVYHLCFRLCRHGANVNTTFDIFRHARAVIRHTENCYPELVGRRIAISHSYLALYGYVSALSHASHRASATWIENPPALTLLQNFSLHRKLMLALRVELARELPNSVLPGPSEGLGAVGDFSLRAGRNSSLMESEMVRPKGRSLKDSGVSLCDSRGVGRWVYKKITKHDQPNTTMDCCSPACFAYDSLASGSVGNSIDIASFLATCCLSCNMRSCSDEVPARVVAVLHDAEVQLSKREHKQLERPFKLILI